MDKVVSNTGPVLHLSEISLVEIFKLFKKVYVPNMVAEELKRHQIPLSSKIKILPLSAKNKDHVKILTNQYDLDEGESAAIALSLQEKADYFLTDDLEARKVANKYHVEVHGTVGIILRAFREKLIDKKRALEKIDELHKKSSLFITLDLINKIKDAIIEFKKRGL